MTTAKGVSIFSIGVPKDRKEGRKKKIKKEKQKRERKNEKQKKERK